MALYRFKICFEEDEEVIRIIEIRSGQTIEDLHFAILKSINFDTQHNAIVYISDDYWKKHEKYIFLPEEGTEEVTMFSSTRLSSLINDPHQKLLYVYDLSEQWTFMIELIGITMKEDPKKEYPFLARSEAKAPKQYKIQHKVGGDLEDDEFEDLTKNLLSGEIAKEMMGAHLDEGETDGMDEESIDGEESNDEDDATDDFGVEGLDED